MAEEHEIGDAELADAEASGRVELITKPRAASARYDRHADRVILELTNGCTFTFPPRIAQDLQDALPDQLADIEISPAGFALHWPLIDVDFSVAGLMAGIFGTAKFIRAQGRGENTGSTAETASLPSTARETEGVRTAVSMTKRTSRLG